MARITLLFASFLLICACARAQSPPASAANAPSAAADANLPHDRHSGLILSADAYTDLARAKEKFGKANPLPSGILPVEVFLRNETSQMIHIDLSTVQLDLHPPGSQHESIDWLTTREVAAAIVHPAGAGTPKASRFPIGLPSNKDAKVDKLAATLQPLTLDADIVPPMSMLHGFLFFDMNHDVELASDSSLYVPDASILPSHQALIFYEVPLGKPAQQR